MATATSSPGAAQARGRADQFQRYGAQFAAPLFRDDENAAHVCSSLEFADDFGEPRRLLRGVSLDELRAALVRNIHAAHPRQGSGLAHVGVAQSQIRQRQHLDGFRCRLLDAAQARRSAEY